MFEHFEIEMSPRDRLTEQAAEELVAFERRETAFRKQEREQRAKELGLPLATADLH